MHGRSVGILESCLVARPEFEYIRFAKRRHGQRSRQIDGSSGFRRDRNRRPRNLAPTKRNDWRCSWKRVCCADASRLTRNEDQVVAGRGRWCPTLNWDNRIETKISREGAIVA